MSQAIVRAQDFKNPPGIHQIQKILYRGEGSPIGQKKSPNLGAIYVDYISGNIWSCTIANDVNGWEPFYTQVKNSITIDTNVQEGDFIGIWGPGTWANASANTNVARDSAISDGSEFSAWMAGGKNAIAALSSTETFNGISWLISANSLLTAPAVPGTGNLFNLNGGGSQTAAWALGGQLFAGVVCYGFMQIFNGDTWALGPNGLLASSYGASGGTLYSAWHTQGTQVGLSPTAPLAEYYNGSTWTQIVGNLALPSAIIGQKGIGTNNSNIICGGAISFSGAAFSYSMVFNGYQYVYGAFLNNARVDHQISGSTLNGLVSGGSNSLGGGRTYYLSSEFYNGCTWGVGNNLSISVRAKGVSSGSRNIGMVAAGTTDGTTKLSSTELHTQSIYRKLDFTNAMGAMDIGIAYGVQNINYTASIMAGDVITHRLPYQRFFGLNKEIHYPSNFYLESSRVINSITANVDGTATVILNTSNTQITKGMLLNITGSATTVNNGIFPVTSFSGGTSVTIKNPNAVNQLASGNATLNWGNRIIGLPTSLITYTAPNVIFTFDLTGTITANTLSKLIGINSIIYVPYATTSGTNGSQYNFGTYVVNSISSNTITCTAIHSQHSTETIVCNTIEILNHSIAKTEAESEDFVLGYNSRMNLITNQSNDANFEKW